MIAEEIIKTDKNDKDSRTNSLTIKTVFFSYSSLPATFFLPIAITVKGIYLPSLYLLTVLFLPSPHPLPLIKRSLSVPTKLITMTEHHSTSLPLTSKLTTSLSDPIPTIMDSVVSNTDNTQMTTKDMTSEILKTSIDTLISTDSPSQIPQPSHSTGPSIIDRDPIPSPVQVKSFHSTPTRLPSKKKKFAPTLPSQRNEKRFKIPENKKKIKKENEEEEEDEPMTKPLTLAEKRKRQAKRADQVKIWKVREEREAREARLQLRRQMMNAPKKPTEIPPPPLIRKKKKKVKFNFDRNCIIQLPLSDQE
ncbi:hypothetical protein EDC96DRAFT_528038 [Choanephora cucurbitarum]|nr:hypothetical protein EDC96DRAFT_528038 [Choanephora cucurbitarum]